MQTYSDKKQRGVALVVALIVLVVMTGVGITMMSGATLQERMASNNRELTRARLAAESALRQAEATLNDQAFTPVDETELADFFEEPDNLGFFAEKSIERGAGLPRYDQQDNVDRSVPGNWNNDNSQQADIVDANYVVEYLGRLSVFSTRTFSPDISSGQADQNVFNPFAMRITAIGRARNNATAVVSMVYTTQAGEGQTVINSP